jgi:cytochrome P450
MAKAAASEPDQEIRLKAVHAGSELLSGVIAARRAEPRDDLISYLLELEIEGRPVTDDMVLGYSKLLFFAGLDTVANAMSFIMHYLAKDQGLQARLRREPDKIPHAMEEMIRRHAVAPVVRIVAKDETWRGLPLRKGDMALLNYPAANIDPRFFDRPDEVDIDRERINHIAFGSGPHRCLGRHLARIEMVVLLEEALNRLPLFSLAPDKPVPMRGGGVLTIESLPLVWNTN